MDKKILAEMKLARDLIIADDLERFAQDGEAELNSAIAELQALYRAHNPDRAAAWARLLYLADRADSAYLAGLSYLADCADSAYLAGLAGLASRADLADLALAYASRFITPDPRLDASVWDAIKHDQAKTHEQGAWGDICGTTHCRGGWAVSFQPYAAELVAVFDWALSAAMVYKASVGSVPNFYNFDNEEVRAEIKAAAELQGMTE